jgi:hypothetical protein
MALNNRIVRLFAGGGARTALGAAVIVAGVAAGLGGLPGLARASDRNVGPAAVTDTTPKKTDKGAASTTASGAAAATSTSASPAGAHAGPPRREARRPATADNDAYRCHPNEDIACTVVRETATGMTIMTMRPGGGIAPPSSWSVVSGTPPGASAYPGGIIYVVPTTPTGAPRFEAGTGERDGMLATANDAPILD